MNYQQTLDFMFSQLPMYQRQGKAAYKSDLSTTLKLDEYFRHPHQYYDTIHIAGTNGKGSVSHMIASVLQQAGFRVGLYTSPHLKDFRERIRINGEVVNEKYVVDFVGQYKGIIEELKPSFFEITAAMAFDYFARERVDVAVIETGMGGRLDSTNIVTPIASAITNIGFDHTQFLGETLSAIAAEKAGIMKEGVPVIVGEKQEEIYKVFRQKSEEVACPVIAAPDRFEIKYSKSLPPFVTRKVAIYDRFTGSSSELEIDLAGEYQQKNLLTVLSVFDAIRGKYPITDEVLKKGLNNIRRNTGFRGRWDVLKNEPLTIADTGHNIEGLTCVVNQLKQIKYEKLHIVFGVVDDKSLVNILPLMPGDAKYYFTKASIPRALDQNKLKDQAFEFGLNGDAYKTVDEAYNAALNNAGKNDLVFIGGSTFVVAEVV